MSLLHFQTIVGDIARLVMAAKNIQESTRYDRQIRVWGAEAQFRLQNARVLLINFTNLNVEVAKNLVLAGVNVTIADDRHVSIKDLTNNFFLSMEDVGQPITQAAVGKVQELNSFSVVQAIDSGSEHLDESTLQQYDVILLSGGSENEALRISQASRTRPQGGGSFFWSDATGDEGIFFADFGSQFQYAPDPQQSNQGGDSSANKQKSELQSVLFPSLDEVLATSWKSIPIRHQPLSKIFVEARVIHKYRNMGHKDINDSTSPHELEAILNTLLSQNELAKENCLPEYPNLDWQQEMQKLCLNQQVGSILTVSILGSFLSQEVIRAISRTGKPGSNVFTYDGDSLVVRSFPISQQ